IRDENSVMQRTWPQAGFRSSRAKAVAIHGALFAVNLLFAVNYIVSKLEMSSFDPLTFAYLRVVGAAIILNTLIRGAAALSRTDFKRVVLYSLLGVVINQSMFLGGLALTSAH